MNTDLESAAEPRRTQRAYRSFYLLPKLLPKNLRFYASNESAVRVETDFGIHKHDFWIRSGSAADSNSVLLHHCEIVYTLLHPMNPQCELKRISESTNTIFESAANPRRIQIPYYSITVKLFTLYYIQWIRSASWNGFRNPQTRFLNPRRIRGGFKFHITPSLWNCLHFITSNESAVRVETDSRIIFFKGIWLQCMETQFYFGK
jgi:hypothetical protein